jgi:peptidoglycan/xylan/chitin deacetylase (PgdA/CDA1 family)
MKTFSLLSILALTSTAIPGCAAEALAPTPIASTTQASPVTSTFTPLTAGTARVANWKDDKTGAFVLMFDDGWPSHWQVAMPELVKRGMTATFYIVPNKGEYKKFEGVWKEKMIPAGMVLGNHTMTHDGFQNAKDTEWEYTEATNYLLNLVPGKTPRLISFALPGVKDYNYEGTDIKALMSKNNLIDRGDFKGHGAVYHWKTTSEMLALADKAIANKGMEYIVFHGVERITPNWGYQDMWSPKTEVFLGLLDGLQERRDRGELWVTDHITAYKYQEERKTAKVRTIESTAKKIALELTSDTDAQLYDEPLTLFAGVPSKWMKCSIVQGETKSEALVEKGQIRFTALPNVGPVVLTPLAN